MFPPSLPPLPPLFAAVAAWPRGNGFYFSLLKLALILAVFLIWVRSAWWVDFDSRRVRLSHFTWNPVLLACGLAGLVVFAVLPWFWLALFLALVFFLTPFFMYVNLRNQEVPEDRKVFTPRHISEVVRRALRLAPPAEDDDGQKRIPIRFIGKTTSSGPDEAARVARAQESRGYRAALEMVYEAIQRRATDIHMEPTKDEMTVRFRVDGILRATPPFSRATGDSVLNIFKVLADLDITEKRKPQDGSFSAEVEDRPVDFRVATAGSVVGEKLVMRILDRAKQIVSLPQLGMRERLRDTVHRVVTQPHGLFIVCGPTGAGKSTTLYACLSEIDRYQKNVITVENPVEYKIENVTQIEVNPKAGKTFAAELRSILRQDPDVIYIGEIRDQETAEIACQAAQTGHMVFTTLHANDTVTAIGRLVDLGVAPFMVADALTAILGQRLVRVLCPACKVHYKPNPDMLRKANLPVDKIKRFFRPPDAASDDGEAADDSDAGAPQRCEHCGGTGYFGRTGVFEFLDVTDRIKDLIRENPNLGAIRQEAIRGGLVTLDKDGLRQVIEGRTSIQELLRVCK